MFRADSDADKTRRDPPQHWEPLEQAHRERHLDCAAMLERPSQKPILNQQLAVLNHPGRELAPTLDTQQIVLRHAA
jgi:hypothetical protein